MNKEFPTTFFVETEHGMNSKAHSAKHRQTIDTSVPRCGTKKASRIDLGIAILSAIALPGICYTQEEISAFAGCARGNIYLIEKRALKKLRNRLFFLKDPVLKELIESVVRNGSLA